MNFLYTNAVFSDHASIEVTRRNIDMSTIVDVLTSPDSIRTVRDGRIVLHKTYIAKGTEKPLLYRVFIDIDRKPPIIVTAYATSKIAKYEVMQ